MDVILTMKLIRRKFLPKIKQIVFVTLVICIAILSISAVNFYQEGDSGDYVKGAQLYYSWDHFFEVNEDLGKHPLWEGNSKSGIETWRCVTCHGWDYAGEDDFPGIVKSSNLTEAEILEWLNGNQNELHDFSNYFTVTAIEDITEFIKVGVTDYSEIFSEGELANENVDRTYGEELYKNECLSCHSVDGSKINFGTAANPLFVGDFGFDNPKMMLHIVRFGHLEINTGSESSLGWELRDSLSLVGYTELLPRGQRDGAALLDDFDYDDQGDTTDIVNLAIVLVIIVLITVSFVILRERGG